MSVTGGTLFAKTRTPLTVWFEAAWRMSTSKSGVSALELQHTLGIGSYQTVWTLLHSFPLAMRFGPKDRPGGTVEVDETYFGGPQSGPRRRAAPGKTMVVIAVEYADGDALGRTRMQIIPDAKAATLAGFVAAFVSPGSEVVTDGLLANRRATVGYAHQVHVVSGSGHDAHELLPAVHLVASLAKRWMAATHQGGVQPEHLGAYLDEFVFRFNRRHSRAPGLIFYRLLQAMLQATPVGYRDSRLQGPRAGAFPKNGTGNCACRDTLNPKDAGHDAPGKAMAKGPLNG